MLFQLQPLLFFLTVKHFVQILHFQCSVLVYKGESKPYNNQILFFPPFPLPCSIFVKVVFSEIVSRSPESTFGVCTSHLFLSHDCCHFVSIFNTSAMSTLLSGWTPYLFFNGQANFPLDCFSCYGIHSVMYSLWLVCHWVSGDVFCNSRGLACAWH